MAKRIRNFHWQDAAKVALGLWIFISAALLPHATDNGVSWLTMTWAPPPEGVGTVPMWTSAAVGIIVATAALFSAIEFRPWLDWVSIVLGLWLLVSPWLLDFHASSAATWNAILAGVAVAGLAAWTLAEGRTKPIR